jgi:hypothetical protein
MKSNLAIATLIQTRMTELGLSRGEFTKRLGYKNVAKGIRHMELGFDARDHFRCHEPCGRHRTDPARSRSGPKGHCRVSVGHADGSE